MTSASSEEREAFAEADDTPAPNVVELPVATRIDREASYALRKGREAKLEHAVVVGWKKNGEFFFASSMASGAEVLLLLEVAKKQLLEEVLTGADED